MMTYEQMLIETISLRDKRIMELEKALDTLLLATEGVYSNSKELGDAETEARKVLKEKGKCS